MRLQVADHGGAASEEAQTHLALVGFLPSVDAKVVGELPRVGEALPTVAAAVPFPTDGCGSRSPVLFQTATGQDTGGQSLRRPWKQLLMKAEAQSQSQSAHLCQTARLSWRGGAAGRPPEGTVHTLLSFSFA